MNESYYAIISNEEITQRQLFAQQIGHQIFNIVKGSKLLSNIVTLVIWHGSLPRGKGGKKYDIDYAVFLDASKPIDLLNEASIFNNEVIASIKEVNWRNDLHYDGFSMFEAHTHWDAIDNNLPHIGVHFYRNFALGELLNNFEWCSKKRSDSAFFRILESWKRYCFFYRNWIYEGVPVYDPDFVFRKIKCIEYSLPRWLFLELRDAVFCILQGYSSSSSGMCTVYESKQLALEMVAILAYAIEGKPMGRSVRYESDMEEFQNQLARVLLSTVIEDNLKATAALSESLLSL